MSEVKAHYPIKYEKEGTSRFGRTADISVSDPDNFAPDPDCNYYDNYTPQS